MQPEDIALIELGGSHDECLYSQVLFLKEHNYRVHIILFEDHLGRMEKWQEVDSWKTYAEPGSFTGRWKLVFAVRGYLKKNNIRRAVINTAEGNIIRKLSLVTGRKTSFTGIIHLSRKLWTSNTQRIINRKIKKYLVLAEFIKGNLEKADTSLAVSHFYPVYFPDTDNVIPEKTPAGQKEFRICIPGAVDYARRDYHSLIDEIAKGVLPEGLRFVLLGRTTGPDGRDLVERIRSRGLENQFEWFDGFIDPENFYGELRRSRIILPLITPGSRDYQDYLRYKITGTYNLAWGFHIPMLMHDSFRDYGIFRRTSIFYETGKLIQTLSGLDNSKLDKISSDISGLKDFDFRIQAERYTRFIED
jgi:hypothetical protein